MELDPDFTNIQGIFISLQSSIGELKQIKHSGGNEKSILKVVCELTKFLISKKYYVNGKINNEYDEKLTNIVLFLILNTETVKDLEQEHLSHLMNIMPLLSKCLLVNIILALNLTPHYCKVLEKFPLDPLEELLSEMEDNLKRLKPKQHLDNASQILDVIVRKLNKETKKQADVIEKLNSLTSAILLNLTGIAAEQKKSFRLTEIYIHIGYTISKMFDLLQLCDINNPILVFIIERLIQTCYGLMMSVTLDVYCTWAEVDINGETLQSLIAAQAYLTIEKYQKFDTAKELIVVLGNIARKPKTINELIQQASYDTIISMVNKADSNQSQWFRAVINPQTLTNEKMMECVDKWSHLCSKEDVLCLLTQSKLSRDPKIVNLVIKCATNLSLDDLILVTIRHFYKNGMDHNLNENIHSQLILLFNKLKDKQADDDICKELHLLLLQNPEQLLRFIFGECLKNAFYTQNLQQFLASLQQILLVQKIGARVLNEEIAKHPPDEQNWRNFINFFNVLIRKDVYSPEEVLVDVILPLMVRLDAETNLQGLKHVLDIVNNLEEIAELNKETERFFAFIFSAMTSHRCKFLEFNRLKHEITSSAVEIIEKYCQANANKSYTPENIPPSSDTFTKHYIEKLLERTESLPTFLQHLLPNVQFGNQYEVVAHLIKILPLCVMHEWIVLGSDLMIIYGCVRTIESFSNCIILLSQVLNSQAGETEEVKCMLSGLKCCLQNYGNLIKTVIREKIKNEEEDVVLTQNVCRVLQQIPDGLKREEGLGLCSLLSDSSLRAMRSDKKFASLVASINEPHVCKLLAEKILQ